MKQLIPSPMRCSARVALRWLDDVKTGQFTQLVKPSADRIAAGKQLAPSIETVQAINATSYSENKRHNLALASERINHVLIQPGELFSFWYSIGKPDQRKGYLPGRSLVKQQLQAEYGGGLCQLSGLLYILALKAGLQIVERYPHSIDIYTDETRFAPLGSDATVVYGYKDLRFINSLEQPICFNVIVKEDAVIGQLCTQNAIEEYQIEFKTQKIEQRILVETLRYAKDSSTQESLGVCSYRLPEA